MNFLDFLEHNKIEFKLNEKLSHLTSFKIGGNAKIIVFPRSVAKLVRVLKFVKNEHLKFYILGNGTNLLCSDNGFDGIIIKLGGYIKDYKIFNEKIFASAGLSLFELNQILLKNSLSGLEFSYGIPGSVGGAVIMNAGAFGHNIGEYVDYVKIFDGEKIKTLKRNELDFAYRHSSLQNIKCVVLGVMFNLKKSNSQQIQNLMKKNLEYRKNTQPYTFASAGSIFKRLDEGEKPVSKLIDECDLKGKSCGDAMISTIHAGFIVNKGQATCKDVINLIQYTLEKLKTSYDICPQLEIKLLGDEDGITW